MNRLIDMFRSKRIMIPAIIAAVAMVFWVIQQKPKAQPEKRAGFLAKVPVSVAIATKGSVRDSFTVVGLSEAYRDVEISSEAGGVVRSISAEVGQRKSAGQTLIKIDDDVAASALRKAEVRRDLARRDFERYKALQQEGAVAVTSFDAMRLKLEDAEADLVSARRRYQDTQIKAPISGTVTSRHVDVGAFLQPGTKVVGMVDLSKVRIRSSVPEKQVSKLSEGFPVLVTTDVYPGRVFRATIASVSAKSYRDHTYQVEVIMDNPKDTPFRAGMFARTGFVAGTSREALVIPRQALVGSVRSPEVFVVSMGVARLRKVMVGSDLGGSLEVIQGVAPGDSIIVSGQNELSEGLPVSVVKKASVPGS
ncbi:MAG: efflux RND transporter periplasmic adaptor subunit [Chlorobiaceae bacterium]|nr:efflux RND transporter periplasmic adaptor subunit [Chlorobiaceae bacterium]